jgi:hypothetical protein
MATTQRILLVEHLDAVGSSLTDLRPRAQVLRNMGFDVRMAAIAAEGEGDLQHGNAERRQSGIEHYDEPRGTELVRRAIETWNADAVVWASSAPGGGEAAHELNPEIAAWWWPSGWSTSRASGPLACLAPELGPGEACVLDGERPKSARLSLWDGPYALVASPLKPADAEHLFDGFARAADQRDEIDLVLLDHPDPELESHAWLQHARATFVTLQRPLAAGLVMRTLAAGCPVMAVGQAAEPVRLWLGTQGVTWGRPERSRLAWDTVAEALARTPAVETAIARGRACAAACTNSTLAARFGAVLGGLERRDRAA